MEYKNDGDFNGDKKVDFNDLQLLIIYWNRTTPSGITMDFNKLQELIINWGKVLNDTFSSPTENLGVLENSKKIEVDYSLSEDIYHIIKFETAGNGLAGNFIRITPVNSENLDLVLELYKKKT